MNICVCAYIYIYIYISGLPELPQAAAAADGEEAVGRGADGPQGENIQINHNNDMTKSQMNNRNNIQTNHNNMIANCQTLLV